MFYKTISKNFAFVISLLFACSILTNCSFVASQIETNTNTPKKQLSDKFDKPEVVGKIKSKEITESSGLVNSRCNPEILWTHNDSGNKNNIYALDKTGKKLGTWKVAGAKNDDWEDIATVKNKQGECFLYIGNIGNNVRARDVFTVYKIKEPKVTETDENSSDKNPLITEQAEAINFTYPDLRHDAEALLVHPETLNIYILTKRFSGASGVYELSNYTTGKTNRLKKIADFSLPALPNGVVTGGEISPDGKRVILCDYFNAYEIEIDADTKNFDKIWKDEPTIIELGERKQGESVCYSADATTIFATSEKKDSPIIEVKRK
jgi:hypothetical protein